MRKNDNPSPTEYVAPPAPPAPIPHAGIGNPAHATWTDDRIREAFIYDGGEAAYHDPINGEKEQRRVAGAIFDEWLAAHDAAVRAASANAKCTCREDVVCGACMTGAIDLTTGVPPLPDDCDCEDREALVRPEGLVCGTCGKVIGS